MTRPEAYISILATITHVLAEIDKMPKGYEANMLAIELEKLKIDLENRVLWEDSRVE